MDTTPQDVASPHVATVSHARPGCAGSARTRVTCDPLGKLAQAPQRRQRFPRPRPRRDVGRRFSDNLLREWARYAPNMTPDNVIATRVYTPEDTQREHPKMIEGGYSTGSTIASQLGRFRPVPDMNSYRVLLDNVYDCSANLHSGPGIGRGSSYNCYREIAEALRLEQPVTAA